MAHASYRRRRTLEVGGEQCARVEQRVVAPRQSESHRREPDAALLNPALKARREVRLENARDFVLIGVRNSAAQRKHQN